MSLLNILHTLNTELMFIVFLFVLLILSILLTIEPTNLKNSYSQISEKHEQNYIMCLTLKANIRIMLCPFTKYYRKNYNSHNRRQWVVINAIKSTTTTTALILMLLSHLAGVSNYCSNSLSPFLLIVRIFSSQAILFQILLYSLFPWFS